MIGNVRMTAGRWALLAFVVAVVAVCLHFAYTQLVLWTAEGALVAGLMVVMVALGLAHLHRYWRELVNESADE